MRKLSLQELQRLNVEEYKKVTKYPVVFILDNIRSALNVGAAYRTADAFGLEGIHLCGICAQPPHKEISKTAIGATASVEWTYFKEIKDSVLALKEDDYQIIGVEQTDQSILLQNFEVQLDKKYALIFGNEVNGISDHILDLIDHSIEIPQFGTKHSFNVSVSMGILGWHFRSKSL
jgi:tRNA G18 (ribose-2'-O)-methylase SpoU